MSEPILQGDLGDRLLPAVLGEIHRRDLEGRLEVEQEGEPILELRIGSGQCAATAGDPRELVLHAAALERGRFRLLPAEGTPPPGGRPLAGLVLEAARSLAQMDRVRDALGSLDSPLALTDKGRAGVPGVELSAEEAFLLSRVDGATSIREICHLSPVEEDKTLRSVYGLTAAGLIRLTPRRSSGASSRSATRGSANPLSKLEGFLQRTAGPSGPPQAAPGAGAAAAAAPARQVERIAPPNPERTKLEERLRLAERQNYYELLGIEPNESTDLIRKTYYALARRFHPDHFHRESVRDLQPALEVLFGRMTEAYQVLSDPNARADYDRRLQTGQTDGRKAQQAAVKELARENFRRGQALAAKGQFVKALPHLEQAVKSDAGQAPYLELLGGVQTLNPRFKAEALQNLRKATELAPTSTSAWLLLGLHYAKYRHGAEARKALKQALSWDASCEPAGTALAALEAGDGKEATEAATGLLRQILQRS